MCEMIFKPQEMTEYVNGEISTKILVENALNSIRVVAFDEQRQIPEHKVPTHACVYVLEGMIDFTVEGKTYGLSQGEMLIIPPEAPHSVFAKMRSKMMLIRL